MDCWGLVIIPRKFFITGKRIVDMKPYTQIINHGFINGSVASTKQGGNNAFNIFLNRDTNSLSYVASTFTASWNYTGACGFDAVDLNYYSTPTDLIIHASIRPRYYNYRWIKTITYRELNM
jgi:hypothetical protein